MRVGYVNKIDVNTQWIDIVMFFQLIKKKFVKTIRKKMIFEVVVQDKNDFEHSTLPALVPVLSTAAGETLLLLVKHAELIINKVIVCLHSFSLL